MSTPQLLDLAIPRRIAINDRGHRYTFTVARIGADQWFRYFAGILSTSEQKGEEQVRTFDTTGAGLKLVEEALLSAEGYASPIDGVDDWKNKIPLSHRRAIFGALVNARRVQETDEQPLALGCETVTLQAVWSADGDGGMVQHNRLVHHFETPSWEHNHRYMRESSRSIVVGGSRSGKTVWRGAQKTLAAIYDELIISVEGYCMDGTPIESDFGRDAIAREMDTFHKVAAANALFESAEPDEAETVEVVE